MAFPTIRLNRTLRGILLGVLAALLAGLGHWAGVDRKLEMWSLDWRFTHLPTLTPSDALVHVDIDDHALEVIGAWPWPRTKLAELVEVMVDSGARAVALDIILPDPKEPRFVKEGVTDLYLGDTSALLDDLPPLPIVDDARLADAFAAGPNVFLGMHVDILQAGEAQTRHEQLAAAERALASTRPGISRADSAAELRLAPGEAEAVFVPGKESAIEKLAADALRAQPNLSLQGLARQLLGKADARSEDMDIVRRAYLRQRGLGAVARFALAPGAVAAATIPLGRSVPPLVTLAQAVHHIGHVTVAPDGDGIVRRIPLLLRTESGVFPQLGLLLAAEDLADSHGRKYVISGAPGAVVITCADGFARRVPVDDQGYMRINWAKGSSAGLSHRHISAVAASDVWSAGEAVKRNRDAIRQACIQLAAKDVFDNAVLCNLFAEEQAVWAKLQPLRFARQAALLFTPGEVPELPPALVAREKELDAALDKACADFVANDVDGVFMPSLIEAVKAATPPASAPGGAALPASAPATAPASAPADGATAPPGSAERELLQQARFYRQLIADAQAQNALIEAELARAKARLAEQVKGKICLVGSTATAAADFVPTPVFGRMPGVQLHANIFDTVRSGTFVRDSQSWVSAVMVLLCGVLVTLITATRDLRVAAALVLAAAGAYLAVDVTVWANRTYWLVMVSPVGAMLAAFVTVTVYRQLTEQRQRRQITSTFKQYLSPAMVDRLAENPALAKLGGEQRELSCLFSDLEGFTSLSARLGPQGTVHLLNRYLDRVGEVMQERHGGTLSKFEGDGVFAFFGAPLPQQDHARRALASAMEQQALLPELNRELHAEKMLPPGRNLVARIGITTGEVNVGNMGSTKKIAYTAIGDSVNLASRLESANKFFGTRVLVDEAAWRAGGAGLIGRPIGKLIVVGRDVPVSAWEPLARADGGVLAPAERERFTRIAEEFARGVGLYSQGRFADARERFIAVLGIRADDQAAEFYLNLCLKCLAEPPAPVDFDGVIRLTEK